MQGLGCWGALLQSGPGALLLQEIISSLWSATDSLKHTQNPTAGHCPSCSGLSDSLLPRPMLRIPSREPGVGVVGGKTRMLASSRLVRVRHVGVDQRRVTVDHARTSVYPQDFWIGFWAWSSKNCATHSSEPHCQSKIPHCYP